MRIFLAHDAGDGDDKCKSWQFSLRHFYLFSVAVFFLPVHSFTNKVSFAALVFIVRRSSSGLGHWKSTFCTTHPLPNGWLPIAVSARKWTSICPHPLHHYGHRLWQLCCNFHGDLVPNTLETASSLGRKLIPKTMFLYAFRKPRLKSLIITQNVTLNNISINHILSLTLNTKKTNK